MRFSYPSQSTPLDGFTIERGIGVGGFGEVYFAISTAGKRVALKKIQRNLDVELRGVRQCINLQHVNLISLWDIRTNEHDENWVVMEYVSGPSLRDVVEAHPNGLPEEEVKRWFLSTASGVAYLHQQDIVHRDLKPANIFLDQDSQVIKIGDYGLSKFISTSRRSGQTESVGTFHYMAPEIGRGVYGKEIDIYALGIILFELLTGDVPFDGESTQEIVMKHLTDDPHVDRVPAGFRNVILKALMKDPTLRYHSVPEMLADMPWPDVAENCQKIISHQAVGPLVSGVGRELAYATSFTANPHQLTHAHPKTHEQTPRSANGHRNGNRNTNRSSNGSGAGNGNAAGYQGASVSSRLPPVIISSADIRVVEPDVHSNADIVFGPLKIASQDPHELNQRNSGGNRSSDRDSIQYIDPQLVPDGSAAQSVPVSQYPEEPIARVVQSSFQRLGTWWMHAKISTPVKLFLLLVASIVVIRNSQWLLPVALGLGLIYLLYYTVRSWLQPDLTDETLATRLPTEKKVTKRDLKQQTVGQIRQWLKDRPTSDRATELLGSVLVAAFGCLVFNLLGLAIGGSMLDATVESWAVYAWLACTSVVACWLLLIVSKFWEHRSGEHVLRRLAMLGIGVIVGAVAFFTAGMFNIDLNDASQFNFKTSSNSSFVIHGMPMLPAYLIFFTGLFGILRWWMQTDPVRSTRLSVISVSLCLIWASVFSHLLEVPMTPNCILAVVISMSIQLAAPWLSPQRRAAIRSQSTM